MVDTSLEVGTIWVAFDAGIDIEQVTAGLTAITTSSSEARRARPGR